LAVANGLVARYLFSADYAPMVSPRHADSIGGIHQPSDLYKLPILGHTDPWWTIWFKAAEADCHVEQAIPGPAMGAQFYEAVAAVAGHGVAILTRNLYHGYLADGRLIQPLPIHGSDGHGYWLVYAYSRRNAPKIKRFRDWILAETRPPREN
jgi:LysR family glycine cleavage system transcriptional activator